MPLVLENVENVPSISQIIELKEVKETALSFGKQPVKKIPKVNTNFFFFVDFLKSLKN